MHLCIYDEQTKRKPSSRVAIAAITASGAPRRRVWEAQIDWNTGKGIQTGDASVRLPRLRDVIDKLQAWETSFQEMDVISPSTHMLVFCPFQLQIPVKAAFGYGANRGWELSNSTVHFPTRLMDGYGGLAYA